MGGYPGLFALVPYREKLAEYTRLENRDLWEYQLNLTPEETGRMIEHVWELKQIRFDYFFFDENCSFRLLELLQVARPGLQLTDQFQLTAIPTDTVKAVDDAGLVEQINYRPSRERELQSRANALSPAEQELLQQLAAGSAQVDQAEFQVLSPERQALVQDGAFRLLRYQANGQERDSVTAQRSFELLQAISRNPPPSLEIERPGRPEDGHDSRTWQVGAGSRGDRAFGEYGLRMAYHDLEDNLDSFPLGAQIEILNLKVRQYEGNDWKLQQLDLASIRSLTPRNQLLQPLSWQVRGGLERVPGNSDKDGEETLVSHISGGAGGSWQLSDDLLAFSLGTGRLEHNNDFAAAIAPALGFDTGLLWRNPLGNLRVEAAGDYFANGEIRRTLSLNQQWEVSQNLGLRLSAERQFSHLQRAGKRNNADAEVVSLLKTIVKLTTTHRRVTRKNTPKTNGARGLRLYYELWRVLRQLFVAYPVWLGRSVAEAFFAIGFVLGVVAFEEHRLRIILIRQDVGRDTIQEPAIVRDHNGGAGEVQQGLFQRAQGFHVEVVGRLVQQQHVGALFQGQRQVQAAALTTGEVLNELLLIAALEVEAADVGARRDLVVADANLSEPSETISHTVLLAVQVFATLIDAGQLHGFADFDAARIRLLLAHQHAEQGRFTGTVTADHADDGALGHAERQVVDQHAVAVTLADVFELDDLVAQARTGRDVDLVGLAALLEFLRLHFFETLQDVPWIWTDEPWRLGAPTPVRPSWPFRGPTAAWTLAPNAPTWLPANPNSCPRKECPRHGRVRESSRRRCPGSNGRG